MKLNQINESINDKIKFKAIFLGGSPGAGKSTVIKRITSGVIPTKVVNTDIPYEFLLKKNQGIDSADAWKVLGEKTKMMATSQLKQYLNGMLPLFIDGTSSNTPALLRRVGILESLGYDIAMVWVDVSLETTLSRLNERNKDQDRKVDLTVATSIHKQSESTKQFLKGKFPSSMFMEVDNNNDNFSAMETEAYNKTVNFFNKGIMNPIANNTISKLESEQGKYLVPSIVSDSHLDNMLSVWYKN